MDVRYRRNHDVREQGPDYQLHHEWYRKRDRVVYLPPEWR